MEIKGVAITATKDFIVSTFGEDGFNKWLDSLSPEARKVYKGSILPAQWYPLTSIGSIPRQKMCDLFYEGDPKGCIELGRYSADYSLKGIYKLLVRMTTIDYLTKKVAKATSLYYRPSKYVVWEHNPKDVTIRITEFPEPHKAMEYNNLGFLQGALEICGYKNVSTKLGKSLADGDEFSELIISWD